MSGYKFFDKGFNKGKFLVLFDLNCVLGYRQNSKVIQKELKSLGNVSKSVNEKLVKPHIIEKGYSTYYRPNSEELLHALFNEKKVFFDVGVWSNQSKIETEIQINHFFKSLKYSLKCVLYTDNNKVSNNINSYDNSDNIFNSTINNVLDNSNNINNNNIENNLLPKSIKRNLNIIFKDYPEYNEKNTVMISNFYNLDDRYINNDIVIPLYHPVKGSTNFFRDAHMYYLVEYLSFLYSLYNTNNSKFKLINKTNYLLFNIILFHSW